MIDVESLVFTNVATPLRSEFSGIRVYGEAVAEPASFPTATLVEQDNATYTRTVDSMRSVLKPHVGQESAVQGNHGCYRHQNAQYGIYPNR